MNRLVWTLESRDDLLAIRDFIAKDAPKTAESFVDRITETAQRLKQFPLLGAVVPEMDDENIRELRCGPYRLIYRTKSKRIEILAVHHGSRLLDPFRFDEA